MSDSQSLKGRKPSDKEEKEEKPTTLSFVCPLDNVRTEAVKPLLGAIAPYPLGLYCGCTVDANVAPTSDFSWKVELKGRNEAAAYRVYTNNAAPKDFVEYANSTMRVIADLSESLAILSESNDKLLDEVAKLERENAALKALQQ